MVLDVMKSFKAVENENLILFNAEFTQLGQTLGLCVSKHSKSEIVQKRDYRISFSKKKKIWMNDCLEINHFHGMKHEKRNNHRTYSNEL